jgi:transcriptional regulator with XRE-family HTH domain
LRICICVESAIYVEDRQGVSDSMGFGARLAEERKRLGLKQAEFAALAGTDVPKQSLYENDRRALRAAYLARLPAVGADPLYVLTGKRTEGLLDENAAEFLTAWLGLPAELQEALARLVDDLGRLEQRPDRGG